MNLSPMIAQAHSDARTELRPQLAVKAVVLVKVATITAMFAICGVATGWLLGMFPGLR